MRILWLKGTSAAWLIVLFALNSLMMLQAHAAPPVQFSLFTNYVLPDEPLFIGTADFDKNGNLDFVVSVGGNLNRPHLCVFMGNGDGSFVNLTNYSFNLQTAPNGLFPADWDEDGNPDIAMLQGKSIGLMFGDGNGSFPRTTNYASSNNSYVITGHFNPDTHLDLASIQIRSNTLGVLLGDGSGKFAAVNGTALLNHPLAAYMAAGDFNEDGRLDLSVTTDPVMVIYLGNGDGSFTTNSFYHPLGRTPEFIVVGDFNSDQHQDLAVANTGDNTATILFGTGVGTFIGITNISTVGQTHHMTVSDFNGDGAQDIALACSSSTQIRFLLGNGDGTFQSHSSANLPERPWFVVASDVNKDGRPDLIYACKSFNNPSNSFVSVALNESIPNLRINRFADKVSVQWPDWTGYQLEASTNLMAVSGWTTVPNIPTVINSRRFVTNNITEAIKFYRLRKL